jgi:hypothetical protein
MASASTMTAERADAPLMPDPGSPAPVHEPRSMPLIVGVLLFLAFVVAATGLQLARQEGNPLVDTMWAEDGTIFLTEALADRSPDEIVTPYAGYLHVVPRSLARGVSLVPLSHAARADRLLAALTVSLLAGYVYFASREFIPSKVGRGALAVLMVLLPSAGLETNANITNLHWYLFVACFFALFHDPDTRGGRVATWAVMIAAVLSEGIILLLVPVALWRLWQAWKNGSWAARSFNIVFLVLAAVHLLVILTDDSQEFQNGPVLYQALPGLYGFRVVLSLLLGERAVIDLVDRYDLFPGRLAAAVTITVLVALAAYVWFLRRDLADRGLLLVAMLYSGVVFLAPTVGRGNTAGIVPNHGLYTLPGARYMLAPSLLLATVIIAVLSQRDPRAPARAWRAMQAIVLVGAALILGFNLRMPTGSSDFVTWADELEKTTEWCEVTGAEIGEVRISPEGLPWAVEVDCDVLTR